MKAKKRVFGMLLSLLIISCNKDENQIASPTNNAQEVADNAKIDNVSDDVLQIVESQSNETTAGRSIYKTQSFLSDCATVNTVQNGNTWTRNIDFGSANCSLFNGNTVRGKIILTFTNDFTATTRTISYAFDNFYHNNRQVEGNRTVVKTILPNNHPQATISLDMTVTTPAGGVFHRTGQRIREFTAGYQTPYVLSDNEFSITGNWTTTLPSGNAHTATINTPVIVKWDCTHIVSGNITFVRPNGNAILDYGSGDCDDQATVNINGVVYAITL